MSAMQDIVLVPAAWSEIRVLADISGQAFQSDSHTLLKAQFEGGTAHEEGMRSALEFWLENARHDVIVARNGKGEAIGWVCWGRKGYDGDLQTQPPPDTQGSPPTQPPKSIQGLKELTRAAMDRNIAIIMPPGTVCRYIVAINVHPKWQSCGVGSALIGWGTRQADQEGVFTWVSSSMGGWPAFSKRGYREMNRLELSLDEFSEGRARPDGGQWGLYVWRWARRDPARSPAHG